MKADRAGSPSLLATDFLRRRAAELFERAETGDIERFLRAHEAELKPLVEEAGLTRWDAHAIALEVRGTARALRTTVPVGYNERGQAQLPRDLHQQLNELRRKRESYWADPTSSYAREHNTLEGTNRTETLRGCPVASRCPVFDADGKLTLSDASPLNVLAREYIGLVLRLLEEPPAPTATAAPEPTTPAPS